MPSLAMNYELVFPDTSSCYQTRTGFLNRDIWQGSLSRSERIPSITYEYTKEVWPEYLGPSTSPAHNYEVQWKPYNRALAPQSTGSYWLTRPRRSIVHRTARHSVPSCMQPGSFQALKLPPRTPLESPSWGLHNSSWSYARMYSKLTDLVRVPRSPSQGKRIYLQLE